MKNNSGLAEFKASLESNSLLMPSDPKQVSFLNLLLFVNIYIFVVTVLVDA